MRLARDVPAELYGVLSHDLAQVIEVFGTRAEAEAMVSNWDRDEPDEAGILEVVVLRIDPGPVVRPVSG